jgi:hypothetical protein
MASDEVCADGGSESKGSATVSGPVPSAVRWAVGILAFAGAASAVMALVLGFIGADWPMDRVGSFAVAGLFVMLAVLYATAAQQVLQGRRSGRTIIRAVIVITVVGACVALLAVHAIGGVFLAALGMIALWMLGKPPADAYLVRPWASATSAEATFASRRRRRRDISSRSPGATGEDAR